MRRLLTGRATRTSLLAVAASIALVAGTTTIGSAAGIVGDPQPELAQFVVAPTGSAGSGVVLPDGTLVLAAQVNDTTIKVCVLHPGDRACASSVSLKAYTGGGGDSLSEAVVVATGGTHVSVVAEDCCYLQVGGGNGGMVVFDSTNDAKTFSAEIPAGTLQGVGSAVYDNGQIVVGEGENGGYTNVQSFAVDPGSASTSIASIGSDTDAYDTSLSRYGSGVLVASDDLTNTHVEYDASGANFNISGSWHSAATIDGSDTSALSGDALLTDPNGSLTGGEQIRFFNGTVFGPAHKVPDSKAGDDGYFTMQQAGGAVHVFFEGRRDGYDLIAESSGNGVAWSPQRLYGSAIDDNNLSPVLGPTGTGVVFESDGTPMHAQPILNAQSVHVAFAPARVKRGHTAVLRGSAGPHLVNQVVTLERELAGRWYPLKTTRESAAGKFAFSFATPATNETYRAVVNYKPGYYQYGYSNAATLVSLA
jgi:hypothetical protein